MSAYKSSCIWKLDYLARICVLILLLAIPRLSLSQSEAPSENRSETQSKTADEKSETDLSAFEYDDGTKPLNEIDTVLFNLWESAGIKPALRCSDGVFVRRIYLDVLGKIPTREQARDFIKDTNPDKRAILIDQLLSCPEFVEYQTLHWCDMLRVKSEFPINLWPHGAATYYRWIRNSVESNKPYNQFARELLLGQGSCFREGASNFYRAVERKEASELADAAVSAFMGQQIDLWSEEKRNQLTVFFSRVKYKATAQWKEEIVYIDRTPVEVTQFTFPDDSKQAVVVGQDPRIAFADWLIRPENKAFNHAIVNRIWYWLNGQGIIESPDKMPLDKTDQLEPLLETLAEKLVKSNYDLKAVYRLILNSRAYQQSAFPQSTLKNGGDKEAENLLRLATYKVRRIEAEVLQDMFIELMDAKITYTSEVPEPFMFTPSSMKTIAIPDSGITNAFLEMFGRPTRDSGLTTDRNNEITATQQMYMLNSTQINQWAFKLADGSFKRLHNKKDKPYSREVEMTCNDCWLKFLSRYPTQAELTNFTQLLRSPVRRDIIWGLINTSEFLCHH